MRQYKVSYLDKNVFKSLVELKNDNKLKFQIIGLLESLSTFDFDTNINLAPLEKYSSLLAVANNIITRGNPTICSRYISQKLKELSKNLTPNDFFYALHLVDTRNKTPELYNSDLGSKFEKAFLNDIPKNKKYLIQFFQHQRKKGTLTNNWHDEGRVDFSFESPYFKEIKKTTIYNKEKELKQRNTTIIEVDGKRYHNSLIDDVRDYETATFGHKTKRITENNYKKDTADLLKQLSGMDYFEVVEKLLKKDCEELFKLQTYVLTPIAIGRLQKLINQYLITKYNELKSSDKRQIHIAIIERDVPCGYLAINDLNELYGNLMGLENMKTFIPKLNATVFADKDFENKNLQPSAFYYNTDKLNCNEYDLVVDISVLWRSGIYQADTDYLNQENSVVIRSSHYTEETCIDEIYCAEPIQYREVSKEIGNEQHVDIPEALPYIEYFLQNIFHKKKFRKGQLPILNRALKNKTVIGLLPTGGGKSLTYQLAALLQPGITVVIDPIRSLMVDQYEGLLNEGIDKCDFINSILSREEKEFVQNKILPKGKTQFLFCSPERLVIQEFRDAIKKTINEGYCFSYCVIDEAHCVSEWGHDFRHPYLNLGENAIEFLKTFDKKDISIFGLTATASFDVLADIERELRIKENDGSAIVRYENTVRDEINYQVFNVAVDPETEKPDKKNIGEKKLHKTQSIISTINDAEKLPLLYNNAKIYDEILSKTFKDYLPRAEQENTTEQKFIEEQKSKILLTDKELPFKRDEEGRYNYASIVFCPHKTSELGVQTFYEYLKSNLPKETVVFFMGSGNSTGSDKQDKISFENLRLFKENIASVMVATKAFGMGIDKSNIRLTIHTNMASSIESFVQESGRAGRDGKVAVSSILYNNQIGRDREILDSFYKKSFKGADKERSVIWELRNNIFSPTKTNLVKIREELNEEFEEEFKINLGGQTAGGKDWTDIIFIELVDGVKLGRINVNNKNLNVDPDFPNSERANMILEEFKSKIPDFNNITKNEVRNYLNTKVKGGSQEGLEHLLEDKDAEISEPVIIPFKNQFYCKDDVGYNIIDENAFYYHYSFFIHENKYFKRLYDNNVLTEETVKNKLHDSIKWDKTYDEFIEDLPIAENYKTELKNRTKLKIKYYIPRNIEDTARAIYRLTSIGIIDTYTIDYQQKVFKVNISRKEEGKYFDNYKKLVERYTSRRDAERLKEICFNDYLENTEKATVISKCLEHLTKFVYNKIAEKRKRAIDDMEGLCEVACSITDPIEQSKEIKEFIYYYFNAKYAREGNIAQSKIGETKADLNNDFKMGLSIEKTIWKYIEDIIDYDDNGAIINNIKHLRGATMRMLRGTSGAPQFNILKSYSLYMLSPNSPQLIDEAITELKLGISQWNEQEPRKFNFENFFFRFRDNIQRHIGDIPDHFFDDIDDYYYVNKNLSWLEKFSLKYLKDY